MMAVERTAWLPKIVDVPFRAFRFSGKAFSEGIEEHIVQGVKLRVYCKAKTVADVFKYRNKLGLETAMEALKSLVNEPGIPCRRTVGLLQNLPRRENRDALPGSAAVTSNSTSRIVQLRRRAKESGRTVSEILQYHAMERFLYRLGQSKHRDAFVLKGAMLLRAWDKETARPTRDIDLLAYMTHDLDQIRKAVEEICLWEVEEDGMHFDPSSIRVQIIKEFDDYRGARAKFTGHLESARIPMQLDIGFGDAVHPDAIWAEFPTVLDLPSPAFWMYSRETVVAEKIHAMAKLGAINSRMKDYHDIWFLSMRYPFEFQILSGAVEATFARRKTAIPEVLGGLGDAFIGSHESMWRNFLLHEPFLAKPEFGDVVLRLRDFIEPCLHPDTSAALRRTTSWSPTTGTWVGITS
jgi:hypothetical protein